jgi:hypothetical protein
VPESTGMLLLDVEKAFDSVWHEALLHKLLINGCDIFLARLIFSFPKKTQTRRRFAAGYNASLILFPTIICYGVIRCYGVETWFDCAPTHKKKLKIIQNKCLKRIQKHHWRFSTAALHEETNMPRVEEFGED